ncbi:MAG TPA: hypothetical protein VIH59_16845 [Candidatus Tectomicrobia bacterium]|jgi:hypothetical protein
MVHRGHNTDDDRTIEPIPVTAGLVCLGSWAGYCQRAASPSRAPAAQVLTGNGVGTHTVNDPLLKALHDALLSGTDVVWADCWRAAGSGLADNPRCADYVPPDTNAHVILLKAYRA